MAEVEIYKLKKTVDPEVREYGMFEFFGMGGPFPKNYVREWAGELNSGNLETLCGRFMLNPPEGYHGGPLEKSDIAVVDGEAYFLDRESGYKFVDVDFDTSGIKPSIHVDYGRYVAVDEAAPIPRAFANVCDSLLIPIGYLGEPGYHGSSKGISDFNHLSHSEFEPCYLHPQFMKGEEAREFVGLLKELTETDRWGQIAGYLRENYPVYMSDLETAREQFAPELLLPVELRPLSNVIPADADKSELAYLAAKVRNMDGDQRKVFDAVIEAGRYCGSVGEIINLTENLDCFGLQPSLSESEYGDSRLDRDFHECKAVIDRLVNSDDAVERALAKHLTRLERCADEAEYGRQAAEEIGGVFIKQGLLIEKRSLQEVYRGVEDIPAEYRLFAPSAEDTDRQLIMVGNVDLSALLLEMHTLGGDYMRDAKHNLQILAGGGNEFFIMMNDHMLTVTPAEPIFHKDTAEHEAWMLMDRTQDIRTFVMSVTERDGGQVLGTLCETDLAALKNSIRFNSIKHDTPADEGELAAYLDVLRWAVGENRRAIPTGLFLKQINEPYMAQSHAPQPGWFRVSSEAARDLLAQDAAFIFKAYPEPPARLMPIDAAKASLWTAGKLEFFVRHDECENLERWARRAAGEMLRQSERGERGKSRDAEI